MNNQKLINRFFKGGHSLYFEDYQSKNFIENYWIPYLIDSKDLSIIDDRKDNIYSDVTEPLLTLISIIKDFLFIGLSLYLIYLMISMSLY